MRQLWQLLPVIGIFSEPMFGLALPITWLGRAVRAGVALKLIGVDLVGGVFLLRTVD